MLKKIFIAWLPLAFLATCFAFLSYALVQQDIRQSANDPQIQIAEDGIVPQNLQAIDISKSLAPFVIVYDENGNPLSSSGTLDVAIPTILSGIFQYVRMSGEDRFTWQPENSVRIAAVVDKTDSGFILAGRNLREVEKREDNILSMAIIGWIGMLIGTFFIQTLCLLYKKTA